MKKVWLISGVAALTLGALGFAAVGSQAHRAISKEPSAHRPAAESPLLAAAFKEIDRLQVRLSALENDRGERNEEVPPEEAETVEGAAEPAPPELSREESRKQVVEVRQAMVTDHASESRDFAWADRMEKEAGSKLRAVLESTGVQLEGVECRTTLCLVQVKGTYDKVLGSLPKALMQSVPVDCDFHFALPEPENGAGGEEYDGVASLDCGQMRENGT